MSIMNFFKSPAPGGQQGQPGQQGNPQSQINNNAQQDARNAEGGRMAGSNQEPANPLDAYSKMWDTADKDNASAPPSFTLDPKILGDVSGSMQFTDGIPPELMQRATSGDMQALVEIINSVGQNVYRTSLQHGSALTDKFVGARSSFEAKQLAPQVKSQLTNQELSGIPNFKHPVIRNQLSEIADRMQRQHPDASPKEIAEMAKKYFTDLAQAMGLNAGTGSPGSRQQQEAQPKTDWSQWLDDASDES